MGRLVNDIPFQRSLMVVNPQWGTPYLIKETTQLLSGEGSIVVRGWKQSATITYSWASTYERDNLQDLPEFGLDTMLPDSAGWVYDEPNISEISETIHLYNIVVNAHRFTSTRPTSNR